MGDLSDIGQKIKGKVQVIKGDINQKRGKGIKGGMQKIKGKFNQTVADTKMKAKKAGAKGDADWDREEDWDNN